MSDDPKVSALLDRWCAAFHETQITQEQAVNAAAEFVCMVMMTAVRTEQAAHQLLNQTNENGHIYINENWKMAEELHRERERGVLQAAFNKLFRGKS